MYNIDYIKALKYSKDSADIFSEKEGHEIHDNASPEIYADWLQDRGLEHIPNFIREVANSTEELTRHSVVEPYRNITDGYGNSPEQRMHKTNQPHMRIFKSGGYGKVPSTMAIKLMIPSSISGKFHTYYSKDLPHAEGKELHENLKSEGVLPAEHY